MASRKTRAVWEFGDFQTPDNLVIQVTDVLQRKKIKPATVIEPTCGKGSFLIGAIKAFPTAKRFIGTDINKKHLEVLDKRLKSEAPSAPAQTLHADFFEMDWSTLLADWQQPILIIGNPPWVTSSELSTLESKNIPEKSNFQGFNGLDAITGKSNFDISEWMLLQHIKWLDGREGTIAMLCKTSVARKALLYAWKNKYHIQSAQIYKIDAFHHFDASVDACLLVIESDTVSTSFDCDVYESLSDNSLVHTIGYHDNTLIAEVNDYLQLRHLRNHESSSYVWRSGIKHDCAKIMELERNGSSYVNGAGVKVELEDTYLYPLYKSSDIANNRISENRKYMLVTQKQIGEDTETIREQAPLTWQYLRNNEELLSRRGSSIYKNRPPFSIFGVGEYTFAPWKVAISGFYKRLQFVPVGPTAGKPAVFDDTIYFLPCSDKKEAIYIAELLNSTTARKFLNSMTFWGDKRPITVDLLKRLNIMYLASELGREVEYALFNPAHELLQTNFL